jgi:ribosomal protein L7/L12
MLAPMDADDLVLVNKRLRAIEHNVHRLLTQAEMSWQEPPVATGVMPDVVEAVNEGNLIEAIKRHRAHTGLGLAEAKAEVEALLQ